MSASVNYLIAGILIMNAKNITGLVIRIFGFGVFISGIKELIYHVGLNGGLCHHFRGIEFSFALFRYFLDPFLGMLVVLFSGTLLSLVWREDSDINPKRILRIVIGIEFDYGRFDYGSSAYVIETTENCAHQWEVGFIRRAYGPFIFFIHEN